MLLAEICFPIIFPFTEKCKRPSSSVKGPCVWPRSSINHAYWLSIHLSVSKKGGGGGGAR